MADTEYGLTAEGPDIKRLDVILEEMHEDLSGGLGREYIQRNHRSGFCRWRGYSHCHLGCHPCGLRFWPVEGDKTAIRSVCQTGISAPGRPDFIGNGIQRKLR